MVLDFGLLKSGLFPSSDVSGQGLGANPDTIIWNDVGIGIVPITGLSTYHPEIPGAPPLLPNWVECNGQTLSDGDSPLDGEVIPDYNGVLSGIPRFFRGGTPATSGDIGGTEQHTHYVSGHNVGTSGSITSGQSGTTFVSDTLPSFIRGVIIMRTK